MKAYNRINNIAGWLCGIIATVVYIVTADRHNSWWDTGEFIASAYHLEIVHQPGAPLFLMIQNLFSNLAGGNTALVAFMMNVGSAVCSGLTIVFLFWTITALARKVLVKQPNVPYATQLVQIIGAGAVGALAYSFTDTFWYSAVESEVYAMSSLCTAAVFWLVLKWERRADEPDANRWLIAIAYVMGLSIGVHLLNLLTIPAIALMVYFRKTPQVSRTGVLKALTIGVFVLAFILWGVIQYSVRFAAYVELFFVNTMGLPFGSGTALFVVFIVAALIYGIYYSIKAKKYHWNTALLAVSFIILGYSSYAYLPIRANTNIALNNNEPNDIFSFYGYLTREQYPSEPLLKGPTYDANAIDAVERFTYRKDADSYTQVNSNWDYIYDKEMLFPRVWSERHADYYRYHLGLSEQQAPTFSNNLQFLFSYQLNHMYWRYFMWNFAGRQNDAQGHQTLTEGNWISGIAALDDWRIGGQSALHDFMKSDPSRNTYFFLPLIFGLLGLLWHIKYQRKDAFIVGLLFFFTGIAVVLYLNQHPIQARERDYAYAGSFYMFSIWIGLGVLGLVHFMRNRTYQRWVSQMAVAAGLLVGPVLLLSQNWDDHDRSGRTMSRDMAYNYLQACEPNAILFSFADNDTFPLWYLQQVEGVRTDVRVVNYGYLQSDWYMRQMMQDTPEFQRLPIGIAPDKIVKGVRDGIMLVDMELESHTDIKTLLDIMLSDNPKNQLSTNDGRSINFLPTTKFQLGVNKDDVLKYETVPSYWQDAIADTLQWEYNKKYVSRAELSLLSILVNNNWERPIYFTATMPRENFNGMDKYIVQEGLLSKLMPIDREKLGIQEELDLINTPKVYADLMNVYKWGNISELDHFDIDAKFNYDNLFLPNVVHSTLVQLLAEEDYQKVHDVAMLVANRMPKQVTTGRQAYYNAAVIDSLYKTNEESVADRVLADNLQYVTGALDYNHNLAMTKGGANYQDIRMSLSALGIYREILAEVDNRRDMYAAVDALEEKYRQLFLKE